MPLTRVLAEFRTSVLQCESLIANSHKADANGNYLFPEIDREQITAAAFLNMFISWEVFLEASLAELMVGCKTINGTQPKKFASPQSLTDARIMIIGVSRYFDYANHDYFRRVAKIYFQDGYPYEPHLSAIVSDLADLKTMRNASAHTTSTTQKSLEALALRVFGRPRPGVTLYQLLTDRDPKSLTRDTIFASYKDKLVLAADLISTG